nr:zinc finger protein 836-like [Penaeus vannamei]
MENILNFWILCHIGDYVGRRSLSSLTLPSFLPSSQARVPLSEEPPLLRPKERATMSILPDRIPLAPLMDKEIFGTGVSIKEELSGDVTEEMWLEVKEEPYDYADEANYEVSEVKVKNEFLSIRDLQDLKNEANEKDSCDIIEDCNTLSKASFVAEENEIKCSSEENEAKHKENHKDITQRKVDRKLKSFVCDVCGKIFYRKSCIQNHMRVHTKEKPYICDIAKKPFLRKVL